MYNFLKKTTVNGQKYGYCFDSFHMFVYDENDKFLGKIPNVFSEDLGEEELTKLIESVVDFHCVS